MAKAPAERLLSEIFFEKWSRTRGPLFDEPASAICRILAVCEVHRARREAPDRGLRVRAARILDEALREERDSNLPAAPEKRARANLGLVDVERLLREAPPGEDLVAPIAKILAVAARAEDEIAVIRHFALAELLAAVLDADTWEIRLRAARTLIARTRDAARRLGQSEADSTGKDDAPSDDKAPLPAARPDDAGAGRDFAGDPAYECRGTGPP